MNLCATYWEGFNHTDFIRHIITIKMEACINKSILEYYKHGSRSNSKLKILHKFIGDSIKDKLGSFYEIHCLPDKEVTVDGKYNKKKVDICITLNQSNVVGIVTIKFIMGNYRQNMNNYFETLTGELDNLSPNYYNNPVEKSKLIRWSVLLTFETIPYYNIAGKLIRHESYKKSDSSRYGKLISNGLLDLHTTILCTGDSLINPKTYSSDITPNFMIHKSYIDTFDNDTLTFVNLIKDINKYNMTETVSKPKNGVVFTPQYICKYMCSSFINNITEPKSILEPSCGIGAFIDELINYNQVTIHGFDIDDNYVDTCREKYKNNKNVTVNTLNFIHNDQNSIKYDIIIGNPPYIRIQHMDLETIESIRKIYPILGGSFDMFMYFILRGIDMLNDTGKLIYIVPNSFLYSKTCKTIRDKIIQDRTLEYVVDFRDELIFPKYSVYTCIIVINKDGCSNRTGYFYKTGINDEYKLVSYKQVNRVKSLLNYVSIKNGIATLADKVFILKKTIADDDTYYHIDNNNRIEKKICKTIYKVSRNETYTVIYPYDENTKCISEDTLKNKYPECYKYLMCNKTKLESRDKGKKKYETWFSYGRRQSIKLNKNNKTKLYISSMVPPINLKESLRPNNADLFYSGLKLKINKKYKNVINRDMLVNILNKYSSTILSQCSVKSGGWFVLNKSSFDIELSDFTI